MNKDSDLYDFAKHWPNDSRKSPQEELLEAAKLLVGIVEGIKGTMAHGVWRDQNGQRLKDTAEWVDLYLAVRRIEDNNGS